MKLISTQGCYQKRMIMKNEGNVYVVSFYSVKVLGNWVLLGQKISRPGTKTTIIFRLSWK